MHRDIHQLTARTHDVLVVGGGIYGLTIACDAAGRGLSVALIERHDFGSGNSFNHLRTIHGGLRYLQTLDIRRSRESILERRTLARIAPEAVTPLAFVLPLTLSPLKGKTALRAGLLLDRLVGHDRNEGVPASHVLPAGVVLELEEAVDRCPLLQGMKGLTGAALWYDYVTTEADRLTFAWALAASGHGAVLANYVEATALAALPGGAMDIRAVDRATGAEVDITARTVVNATGAALDALLAPARASIGTPLVKAINLVTRREAPPMAVGGRTASGRTLFIVPWRGRALFGTWESGHPCRSDDVGVSRPEVAAFIDDLNRAFPLIRLTEADVTFVHRGVVPAVLRPDGTVALEGRELIRDHTAAGMPGLISVAGTKYTTARAVAERVTDRLVERLGRPAAPCRTAVTPLPLPRLTGDALLAEAARSEMVVTLEDAVVRRTPLGALGYPGHRATGDAARIVGDVLGWSPEKRLAEIEAVRGFYGTLNAWKT